MVARDRPHRGRMPQEQSDYIAPLNLTIPYNICSSNELVFGLDHFFARCSILAHVSRKPIVRLNTGFPGVEAGSMQK